MDRPNRPNSIVLHCSSKEDGPLDGSSHLDQSTHVESAIGSQWNRLNSNNRSGGKLAIDVWELLVTALKILYANLGVHCEVLGLPPLMVSTASGRAEVIGQHVACGGTTRYADSRNKN
jgi:hypothetical protein